MSRARTLANYVGGGTTATEFDVLDGLTSTTAELNHVDGLTSAAVGINDTQALTNKTLTSPIIAQDTSTNITGTLTGNALYLSNSFVMTGDTTVSGKTTLARITNDDATTPLLTDTNGQKITVGGTLTLGVLVN